MMMAVNKHCFPKNRLYTVAASTTTSTTAVSVAAEAIALALVSLLRRSVVRRLDEVLDVVLSSEGLELLGGFVLNDVGAFVG